jgi:HK97 family phage portal protein
MCGVRFLAETQASLPLRVYQHVDPRGKKILPDHPIARLVREPNPEQTWFEVVELMQIHAVLWGNAYAQIIWNGAGEPIELWPLNPDRVQLRRDQRGKLVYQVSLPRDEIGYGAGSFTNLPADEVLHIRGFSRWGLLGKRIAFVHREAIGLGLATEEFAARFFGYGMHAGGILEHPAKLSKDAQERLRESFDRQAQGLSRSHRTLLLEEGMKWVSTMIEPEKAQFLGVRQFQVVEAARILRIPPHLLYELSRATFTNIEHQSIDVVVFTLLPWSRRWEARLDKQLISTKMRNSVYTKFALEGLLRGDTATRYEAYSKGRTTGWLSVNDIRELEDMNPVQGGDTYLQPMNMQPLGAAATAPATPPGDPAGASNAGGSDPAVDGTGNRSRPAPVPAPTL